MDLDLIETRLAVAEETGCQVNQVAAAQTWRVEDDALRSQSELCRELFHEADHAIAHALFAPARQTLRSLQRLGCGPTPERALSAPAPATFDFDACLDQTGGNYQLCEAAEEAAEEAAYDAAHAGPKPQAQPAAGGPGPRPAAARGGAEVRESSDFSATRQGISGSYEMEMLTTRAPRSSIFLGSFNYGLSLMSFQDFDDLFLSTQIGFGGRGLIGGQGLTPNSGGGWFLDLRADLGLSFLYYAPPYIDGFDDDDEDYIDGAFNLGGMLGVTYLWLSQDGTLTQPSASGFGLTLGLRLGLTVPFGEEDLPGNVEEFSLAPYLGMEFPTYNYVTQDYFSFRVNFMLWPTPFIFTLGIGLDF